MEIRLSIIVVALATVFVPTSEARGQDVQTCPVAGFSIPTSSQQVCDALGIIHDGGRDDLLGALNVMPTPLVIADLPPGENGLFRTPDQPILLRPGGEAVILAFTIVHEATHLKDNLEGNLPPNHSGEPCYQAEIRAYAAELSFAAGQGFKPSDPTYGTPYFVYLNYGDECD